MHLGVVDILKEIAVVLNFSSKSTEWDYDHADAVIVDFYYSVPKHLSSAIFVPLESRHRLQMVLLYPLYSLRLVNTFDAASVWRG